MADSDAILQQVDEEELLELAKSLVRIPSFLDEESAAARFVAGYLEERGYEVHLEEVERGRVETVALLRGSGGGKSLMFNGHLDTEPLVYAWERNPFEPWVERGRLYGAGVFNMKSGVAAMIHAAEAVRRSGVRLKGDLMLCAVLGECQGGAGTIHLLRKGYRTDYAVVPEPYGAHEVVTKHGGMSVHAVHLFGSHPGRRPGVNAIDKALKVIPAVEQMSFSAPRWDVFPSLPWVKVGSLIAGRGKSYDLKAPFRDADFLTLLVHVTLVPGQTAGSVQQDLRQVLTQLAAEDPELRFEVEHPPPRHFGAWLVDFPATDESADTEVGRAVIESYRQVTGRDPQAVGAPSMLIGAYYGDDDAHLWKAGIPTVIYGPGGSGYRVEYTLIDEMVLCSQVLALTALHICGS